MEYLCDICGNVGVRDAILTCCQCKINTEHMYCMMSPLEKPCDWVCEVCKSGCKVFPASNWTKKVPSMSKSPKSVELHHNGSQSEKIRNFLDQKKERVAMSGEKKVTTGKTKYISTEEVIRLSSEAKNPKSNSKQVLGSAPCRKSGAQKFRNVNTIGRQESEQHPGGNVGKAMEPRSSCAKNVNRTLLPDLEEHAYTPSLYASWRGSFKIHSRTKGHVNFQIQAHCPSRVRSKVYGFSKNLPSPLQFQLVSCKEFWIYFFHEYSPDLRDIGLYFFSSDTKRLGYFVSFVDFMSAKELALRKRIDDIELLVFTSKLLPTNYWRCEGKHFLWGVFRHMKRDPISSPLRPKPSGPPTGNKADNNEEVDMDIDMVGGVSVGLIDVPVRKGTQKGFQKAYK